MFISRAKGLMFINVSKLLNAFILSITQKIKTIISFEILPNI